MPYLRGLKKLIAWCIVYEKCLENCYYVFCRAKWYTVSVTEEEVHRGMLYIDNREDVTFYYRRKFTDPHKHFEHKLGRRYMDVKVNRLE